MESSSEFPLPASNRKFYDIPKTSKLDNTVKDETSTLQNESESASRKVLDGNSTGSLLSYIDDNVIGKNKCFSGAFGMRNVIYCDYVASGRSLKFIEDYIQTEVLPEYGNTHTTTTVTSLQTTLFRHEARDIIRNAVHASEHDAVIFTGAGTTAAVHKLIRGLDFSHDNPPVVFVGPYEHHSAFLPWHDVGALVIRINSRSDNGQIDAEHLTFELKKWQPSSRPLVGMFSAASNVTGLLTDVDRVTILLHKHGALALWDYATAGPYVRVDMNPVIASADQPYVYKDAVVMSPHKFVGGVGTPGLLVAKKALFTNATPSGCGGGSVFFVRRTGHRYLQEVEMREEGGTPAIVESIRAGLCFQLKEAVTTDLIMERESYFCRMALERWSESPNLVLLGGSGNTSVERLPIFSFLIKHSAIGLFLHHNFVCSLLNDMFGIQTRGGCACAGPYAQDLLGIDETIAVRIETLLVEDGRLDRTHLRRYREYSSREILRPGFSRLNFPYFMPESDVRFVIETVAIIAEQGWKMLPQYIFNPETGEWRHWRHQVFKDRKWLGHIDYTSGHMTYQDPKYTPKGPLPSDREDTLDRGRRMFAQIHKFRIDLPDQRLMFDGEADLLRWFLLPSEAWDCLREKRCQPRRLAFCPGNPVPRIDYKNPAHQTKPPNAIVTAKKTTTKNDENETDIVESETTEEVFAEGMRTVLDRGFVTKGEVLHGVSEKDREYSVPNDDSRGEISTHTTSLSEQFNPGTEAKEANSCDLNSLTESVSLNSTEQESNPSSNPSSSLQPYSSQTNHDHLENFNTEEDKSCLKCVIRKDHGVSEFTSTTETEVAKVKWESPPKKLFHDTVEEEDSHFQALEQYSMITAGDRVLVCLSGGKDSLSLLHTLHQYQFYAEKKGVTFVVGAVTVDPKTASYDPSPLKGYLKALGVPYFYEEQAILEQAANLPYECASICSFCSRMKRGRLYATARREGYNVLAMGQHLDDLAESLLMNSFHNGVLRTMKANYTVKEGDLRVIRPFVHVREKDLRTFAEERKLPVIAENCPACFEAPKERHRMKQLLANQELLHPRLYPSLRSAMQPLMAISKPGVSIRDAMDSYLVKGDEVSGVDEDDDV